MAGVSKSGYYRWKSEGYLVKEDRTLEDLITIIHESKKGKAGIRVIKMILERDFDLYVNLKRVYRIKKKLKLVTLRRRKNKYQMFNFKDEQHRAVPNLLQQNFAVEKRKKVLSIDITYLDYGTGKRAYLFASKDIVTKEIVYHKLSERMLIEDLVLDFEKCLFKMPIYLRKRLTVHSDQGGHFTSGKFRKMLERLRVTQSMSRRGNCLDNAPIESFFGHLKDEAEYRHCSSFTELKKQIDDYISYYNNERPQWGLKRKTPTEYRGSNFRVFY
jgi:putative transposase